MGKPDLRRPVAGPYRQSRWAARLEAAFGWVAKGTLVLAGLAMVALAALTGDVSALADLPSTRKGWLYLLLILIAAVALLFALHHYWVRPTGMRPAS
ncbi:hypothetical protein SAMN05443026_5857 [Burkholderia orbicola]|uniref:hypothetical protein n=1 Tax=Burkholderia cepacia complex TaxID=87882 RepID=UPI000884D520|nr:hypothetical protein [Burkholderia cenocepacia]SDR54807.1 hypothetical protein SAMN05443026_5857 [Burkholderia orbicola]MBR8068421.1 hypothetical protein [Burkholderia cenocepacia]MBR8445932.1 hypothetical protein [Burkholderia cenocepacia]MBR8507382.1 hypothetical protein [Burkholderia cenocepacia]RQV63358.1 hypothetical protein DF020_00725 [Burkholderia cenocepacia]